MTSPHWLRTTCPEQTSDALKWANPTVLEQILGGLSCFHADPYCTALGSSGPAQITGFCSCIAGDAPNPQRHLDTLLLLYRHHLELSSLVETPLLPGFLSAAGSSVLCSLEFTVADLDSCAPLRAQLLSRAEQLSTGPELVPAIVESFAYRSLTFTRIAEEVDHTFSGAAASGAKSLLRRWLSTPELFDNPRGALEDAWSQEPVPALFDRGALLRLGSLFSGWVTQLQVVLLSDRPMVCRVEKFPEAGEGLLGLRTVVARTRPLVPSRGGLYGWFPHAVAQWLATTSTQEISACSGSAPVVAILGPAATVESERWEEAGILYRDGGYHSFPDALHVAALL